MEYLERIQRFKGAVKGEADLIFFPISADLEYLTGVSRDMPNFGAIMYPGDWIEGLWMGRDTEPILVLTRMTAEFHAPRTSQLDLRVLDDQDDPIDLLRSILEGVLLPDPPRLELGDSARAETLIHLQKLFPGAVFYSATTRLRSQRMIKTAAEIEQMRKAGGITEAAFGAVLPKLRHGMTELDIISEVDHQLRKHGAFGPSFNTALYCSGPQHPLLFGQQQNSWQRELNPPVSILFDFGAVLDGYCYDFGRTVLFGEPDEDINQVHTLVMEAQAVGISAMQAGEVTASQVDAAARGVIESAGFGDAFRHRLGHGIGLDVHEPPFLTTTDQTVLEGGMLFTVEPSIMLEHGLSARVEDVVLVGEAGGIPLTTGFQDLIVID